MQIVQKSQHVKSYAISYEWNDTPGAGFSFPCDEQGNIFLDEMPQPARDNLRDCQSGMLDVTYKGIETYSNWRPAQGCCHCGEVMWLTFSTNECEKCGRLYNLFGQDLAPRSQWSLYDYERN